MDIIYAEIGRRMRSIRKTLRLTQAQLAESAGIDASFYGQIERGANVPSLKTFLSIARALGVDPADLLSGFGRRRGPAYARTIELLIKDLDPRKKRLMLDIIGDVVSRFKK